MCISYLILVTCKGSDLRLFLKFDLGKLLPLVCRSVCKLGMDHLEHQSARLFRDLQPLCPGRLPRSLCGPLCIVTREDLL